MKLMTHPNHDGARYDSQSQFHNGGYVFRYQLIPALAALLVGATITLPMSASAQGQADPAAQIAAQKITLEKFARMDGVWRGPAWTILPSGEKHNITQTERIGPFLDGSIKVIEGRGYETDGRVGFNAFGVISYSTEAKSYRIRSHAMGRYGDFAIVPTDDGYSGKFRPGQ